MEVKMSDFVTVISNVGFPIAGCIAMGYFCMVTLNKMDETLDKLTTQLALNTRSIETLINHIEREEKA